MPTAGAKARAQLVAHVRDVDEERVAVGVPEGGQRGGRVGRPLGAAQLDGDLHAARVQVAPVLQAACTTRAHSTYSCAYPYAGVHY